MPGKTRLHTYPFAVLMYLVGAMLLVCSATSTAANSSLSVNTGFTAPVSTVFEQVLSEVFRRLSLDLKFQEVSAERSLILVSEGIDDAECCRIPDVVRRDYPNLITVPESVFEVRFSAFAKRRDIQIDDWNSLRPYSVGTVTGWKILVNNIAQVKPLESFVLDDASAMFRMLDMDRIEIATLGYLSGLKVIDELGLGERIQPIEPPLASRKLYMMIHPRHAGLVEDLARVIREVKRDGTLDAIVIEVTGRSVVIPRPSGDS